MAPLVWEKILPQAVLDMVSLGGAENVQDYTRAGPDSLLDAGAPSLPDGDGMLQRFGLNRLTAAILAAVLILVASLLSLMVGRWMSKRNTPEGKIMRIAAEEWRLMVPATFALFMSTLVFAMMPFLGGQFAQVVGSGHEHATESLDMLTMQVIAVTIVASVGDACNRALFELAGERIICRLRNRVFEALLRQEVGFFDEQTSGALISRLASDTTMLQEAASVNISGLLGTGANLLLSVVVMFAISWKLSLAMMAVVPAITLLALLLGKMYETTSKEYQEHVAESSSVASDTFGNLRTVRAFQHGQATMLESYFRASSKIYKCGRRKCCLFGTLGGGVFMLFFCAFALVLRYGGGLVLKGEMHQGDFISFILYTVNTAASMGFIGALVPAFMGAAGATTKLFEIIDREPLMQEGEADPSTCQGEVEFKDVSFAYPTRLDVEVLQELSWKANTDAVTALVGQSGSGKSSCIGLIQRLYDVTGGSVHLDGHDVRQVRYAFLRRNIAIVSQEPVLFSATIEKNILFGVPQSNPVVKERMIEAAKLSNCESFVTDFPDGYQTLVGERGTQLSGGQKQRVAIARAIIMEPTILMLDEATSALDAESEGIVQDALNRLLALKGRTFIVVAHRLSTIRGADKIVVMSRGKCLEQGTHPDLLAQGGAYRDLVQRQLDDKTTAEV